METTTGHAMCTRRHTRKHRPVSYLMTLSSKPVFLWQPTRNGYPKAAAAGSRLQFGPLAPTHANAILDFGAQPGQLAVLGQPGREDLRCATEQANWPQRRRHDSGCAVGSAATCTRPPLFAKFRYPIPVPIGTPERPKPSQARAQGI